MRLPMIQKMTNESDFRFSLGVMKDNLSFDVELPCYNEETEAAMSETRDIMSGRATVESYDSAAELFSTLDGKGL